MQYKTETNGMAQVLATMISNEGQSPLLITTVSGEQFRAFEPITIGPDFLMFRLGVDARQFRPAIIPWASIGSITI